MTLVRGIVDAADPETAYQTLRDVPDAALVDVRTRAEWTFVGLPDLSGTGREPWLVEWVGFPEMQPNPRFDAEMRARIAESRPSRIFFLCRSGARSQAAAERVAALFAEEGTALHCTNVAEGFEGDRDEAGQRGRRNGWKARGLPWMQS